LIIRSKGNFVEFIFVDRLILFAEFNLRIRGEI